MKINIDRSRCIGAGQCALTAPKVFTQDDDGFSELLPGHEDALDGAAVKESVKVAVRVCPVQAITIE
ncbi:ferredoxin [Streptomyces sp. NBC_00257]|uniref:ferredoxin n=1 Tax=Streptomyces TaxID=1883 RepID=UPI002256252B|nr:MULTISPECIES: ferredoxin [unclassified Streptomyces]WSW06128.1 ferredoxin [Streptomyces sp. NBC_01005]WTB56029.1 ferredoxin [Streptomyces sp. NBC_00826]WTC95632.1 ferredoxin [Streptomyces sp. NBC_01650]WTH91089.1 ferredoxin [Streptomyces sp. NBC_00825]WTH99815.1 ferredoxin [Streptomyces sp. NBC_00822]